MKRILASSTIVVMSLAASGILLAEDDLFVGTWKLNVAKSKYSGRPTPKSLTRTVVARGSGETITYQGVAADGSPVSYSITTNLDGKDSPISGKQSFGADTIAATRVDTNTITFLPEVAKRSPD